MDLKATEMEEVPSQRVSLIVIIGATESPIAARGAAWQRGAWVAAGRVRDRPEKDEAKAGRDMVEVEALQ